MRLIEKSFRRNIDTQKTWALYSLINSKSIQMQESREYFMEQMMSLLLIQFDEQNRKVPRESYFVQYGKDQMAVSNSWDCATKSAVDHFDPHGQSICCWCCVSECKPLWLWIFDLSQERAGPVEKYTVRWCAFICLMNTQTLSMQVHDHNE